MRISSRIKYKCRERICKILRICGFFCRSVLYRSLKGVFSPDSTERLCTCMGTGIQMPVPMHVLYVEKLRESASSEKRKNRHRIAVLYGSKRPSGVGDMSAVYHDDYLGRDPVSLKNLLFKGFSIAAAKKSEKFLHRRKDFFGGGFFFPRVLPNTCEEKYRDHGKAIDRVLSAFLG